MTLLKNGSTLLVEIPTSDRESVVLALTVAGAFATWRKDNQGNTFLGDYHPPTLEGLQAAIESLVRRSSH